MILSQDISIFVTILFSNKVTIGSFVDKDFRGTQVNTAPMTFQYLHRSVGTKKEAVYVCVYICVCASQML
jgi:hypothetical protein